MVYIVPGRKVQTEKHRGNGLKTGAKSRKKWFFPERKEKIRAFSGKNPLHMIGSGDIMITVKVGIGKERGAPLSFLLIRKGCYHESHRTD